MPPKPKYTKEEIVNAAYELTREKGIDAVVAREVGKRLHLRKTPELKFVADDSIERGMGIAKMIGEIVPDEKSDSEND